MLNKCVRSFRLALIALSLSTLNLGAIPLITDWLMVRYVLAGTFWVFLIAELVFLACGNRVRKEIEQISPHMKQKRGLGKIGMLCFFQNREATIADTLLLVSAACVVSVSFLRMDSVPLTLVSIVATYLFTHLHCILNGILYKSIKHYKIVIHKRRERK